ncbi:RrF2 family transcriptional regulator [Petralouisia muris]|uniref:RrF2 family transcriptional regulator n=1 Tax=Petralouisia muris TaxID=3032872 RepID=A0AC61RU21_9FIRM|nr:RrF2 family transcriptional regulator [Petralouisia muris]TGY93697.1 RrF2 family transcriptional regulator [Petralouisia muris]
MKISTKGRYALRLMLDLALEENQIVRLKDVARRQEISMKYLEQIISVFQKCGYVKSLRGPGGGYMLAKKPKEYTVGMILRQIEGSLAPVACLEDEENSCSRSRECVTLRFWQMLYEAINGVVDQVTLEDLVEWEKEIRGTADYSI